MLFRSVLGVCELNYDGASDDQIAACQVVVDPDGMEDDLRKTREAGFDAHLVKPVNIEQLREMLVQITTR